MSKNSKKTDSRFKSLKTFSTVSCIIVIAIAIIFNVLLDQVLAPYLTFDLSATKQNSITPEFKEFVDGLPSDTKVRIVGLFERPDDVSGSAMQYVIPMLDNLVKESDGKISVEYVDIEKNPAIVTELDPEGLVNFEANTFVLNCNSKNFVVTPAMCFMIDEYYLAQYNQIKVIENMAQVTFANAIANLTNPNHAKAYFLSGLNEDSHEYVDVILSSLCVDSVNLPVSDSFTVPDDCEILFILGINQDLSEKVAFEIKEYLQRGGKLFVAVSYTQDNAYIDFKNLNDVLHDMNINIDPYVICENDTSYMLDGMGLESYLDVTSEYSSLLTDNSRVRASYMRPVREYDNPKTYINVAPVLQTSPNCVVGTEREQITANFTQLNAGMYATYTGMENPPEVYVFGTNDFTNDAWLSQNGGVTDPNARFTKEVIKSLLNVDNTVNISSQPIANYSLNSGKVTANSIVVITFFLIVIIPLAFIIIAAFVYNKRKNL